MKIELELFSYLRDIIKYQKLVDRKLILHSLMKLLLLFITIIETIAFGQTNPNFNLSLQLDYTAAEQTILLYEDRQVNTEILSSLRGNRIAASTAGMIANNRMITTHLKNYLDSIKYHQFIKDDIYHLEESRKNVHKIKMLFDELKTRNFTRRVIATIEQIFPTDAAITLTIPIYVVALGHGNVDAFVRRIIWHGDIPQFVDGDDGELTIVINLSQSIQYGDQVDEQFVSLLGIVAHEVFHAAYEAYKSTSSSWDQYYQNYHGPFYYLLDLTQNEGIAYYLSLDQFGRGNLPRNWHDKMRDAFSIYNKNAEELLTDTISSIRANEIIRKANLSGYWESYGSMVGMFIAREIDLRLGRAELIDILSGDPIGFFEKYIKLSEIDSNLPRLSYAISRKIRDSR
ncbi:MAG: hypothetical protein QME52_13485 [Bacteroidota bacterium]|nr:hypothetical protein [Bacteroidota bacterium]